MRLRLVLRSQPRSDSREDSEGLTPAQCFQQHTGFVVGGFVGVIGRTVAGGEAAGFLGVLKGKLPLLGRSTPDSLSYQIRKRPAHFW